MAKQLTKTVSIIPSPFRVVTDYEREFTQAGMEFIAGAVKEVMGYVKKAQQKEKK